MKKKVLFVTETLAGGGAEKVLSTLVANLDKDRFDVSVLVFSGGGRYTEEIKKYGRLIEILRAPDTYHGITSLWYKIKYYLVYKIVPLRFTYCFFIPQNYDVEVAFLEGRITKLMAFSTNKRAKKLAWVHCNLKAHHWTTIHYLNDREEKGCYERFDEVITMSKTQKASLVEMFDLKNVKVCYNPVDSNEIIRLSQQNLPDEIDSCPERLRLVSVGRLDAVKGFDRLLHIVKSFKKESIEIDLWIIGEGSERSSLEQYIISNGLQNNIKLLGFQPNPYKFMKRCDVFVCSSLSEGFCTSVTESLILGIPVVSTQVSGIYEQLGQNNEFGIVTENNEEALKQGINMMISDASMMSHYKKQALLKGKTFKIEQLMKEIENTL